MTLVLALASLLATSAFAQQEVDPTHFDDPAPAAAPAQAATQKHQANPTKHAKSVATHIGRRHVRATA